MAYFTAINAPGAYFTAMDAPDLDPFAVYGLYDDDLALTARGFQLHLRNRVIKHVFKRPNNWANTVGPNVPRWRRVNAATLTPHEYGKEPPTVESYIGDARLVWALHTDLEPVR